MSDKRIKWAVYTVLVGLIPIIARLLIYLFSNSPSMELVNPADLAAFGLVLHISTINEIENQFESDKNWKTILNGTSFFFIFLYALIYTCTVVADSDMGDIDLNTVKICSIIFCIISLGLGYSVYHRMLYLDKG